MQTLPQLIYPNPCPPPEETPHSTPLLPTTHSTPVKNNMQCTRNHSSPEKSDSPLNLSDDTITASPDQATPLFCQSTCNNELLELEKIRRQIEIPPILVKTSGNEAALRSWYNCLQGFGAVTNIIKNRITPGTQDQGNVLYRANS